jgi:hypothetical protein
MTVGWKTRDNIARSHGYGAADHLPRFLDCPMGNPLRSRSAQQIKSYRADFPLTTLATQRSLQSPVRKFLK